MNSSDTQDPPRTPERREDPSIPRSATSFRNQRKLIDTPSSAQLVEKCLQQMRDDQHLSEGESEGPKLLEDAPKSGSRPSFRSSTPNRSVQEVSIVQTTCSALDELIAQKKKALSDIQR